ncbi:MAG: radical SAM protein [Chloroflexota bacterium]
MPTFTEKQFSSILNKKKLIDSWFWDRYTINPYNGCLFGCVYCDARSGRYRMPEDFENDIVVKQQAAEMLDLRLRRARTLLPDVVGLGTVTDSYQGAEKVYENGRKILEVLARHAYPVHIATKSNLVLRDAPLLDAVGAKSWCSVSVTITTLQPEIARFLDHRSPSPQRRLDTIAQLKAATKHVQVGLLLIPLVPFLTDDVADLEQMFQAAQAAGADYLIFGGGMTMHDMQARWFLTRLQQEYPELVPKYAELYQFTPGGAVYDGQMAPPAAYTQPLYDVLLGLSEKYGLPWRMPRFIPQDFRRVNYLVAEKLLNEARLRQMRGEAWETFFWAGQNIQNLGESLTAVCKRGELTKIRNVRGAIKNLVQEYVGLYTDTAN